VWSVREQFGSVSGEASTYLRAGLPLQPTLALRAGGKKLWGEFPFHEAAFIGGPDQVHGLRRQRYAGDAAAFGNAELRLTLARPTLVVPTDVGVFALADAGRVYVARERSDRWHTGVGGGIWLSFYQPMNTVSLAVARSEGAVRVYFQGGLSF
jgi:hemolysin activation/secretion protein